MRPHCSRLLSVIATDFHCHLRSQAEAMAEVILGGIVDAISHQLDSLISMGTGPALLGVTVGGRLEELQRTLHGISHVLGSIERFELGNHLVFREWLDELSCVINDVEDVVDDLHTKALQQRGMPGSRFLKEVRIFFSSSNPLLYRRNMALRLEDARRRLDGIQHNLINFNLLKSDGLTVLLERRRGSTTGSFCHDPSCMIGRDGDKSRILELLLHQNLDANAAVLPIGGVRGVGKTTLAQAVFLDKHLKEYFELRLWVSVPADCDLESLMLEMLVQCPSESVPAMDEAEGWLGEYLHGKKVLLVLDDVREDDQSKWSKLQQLVNGAADGSKILVTTRSLNAAKAANTSFVCQLSGLSEDESLTLLMRETGKTENDVEWSKDISKEIVGKCAGLPLAIKSVGRTPLSDWSSFTEQDLSELVEDDHRTMTTLQSNYSSLQPVLKRCFAYFSLFPKDYTFDSLELINLWISQGYIERLEVGYDHIMELASKSFLTEKERDVFGNILACKMNRLVHDLAKHVVGHQWIMLDGSNRDRVPESCLHLSTLLEDFDLEKVGDMHRLRTFLFLTLGYGRSVDWDECMSRFKKLRALRLRGVHDLENIPKSVGRLRHLRHLDLSNNEDLEALPTSISKLHNLITLDLNGCCWLRELPRGISKLASMRHVYTRGCDDLSHMPKGVEKLTCLQTLCQFVVGKKRQANAATLIELKGLIRLKDLAIRHLEREVLPESVASCLQNSSDLRSLELEWEDASGGIDRASHEAVLESLQPHKSLKQFIVRGYGGDRLAAWCSQLDNLVQLEIRDCLHCKHLPSLHHLPNLEFISLENMRELEHIELSGIDESSYSLPLLQRIVLKNLPEFKGWEKRRGNKDEFDTHEEWDLMILSIQDPEKLEIHGCPKLSCLRPGFLSLWGLTDKILKKLLMRSDSEGNGMVERNLRPQNAVTSIHSVSLNELESIEISNLVNVEYLPEELLKSLPAVRSVVIKRSVRLKALNGWKMLRYLSALTKLEISMCPKFGLSAENGDEDRHFLQQQEGHRNLYHLSLHNIPKMENLPGWIQFLPNLEELEIRHCNALKALPQFMSSLTSLRTLRIHFCEGLESLPGRAILQLSVSSLESLEIRECWRLDFSEEEDREFSGPSKLRKLEIDRCENMRSLPWWIQFLPNLEELSIRHCNALKALPQFMSSLTSLRVRTLRIYYCEGLESLPGRAILQLSVSSLESLEIRECPQLDFSEEEDREFSGPSKLRKLEIDRCGKMRSLPWWIQFLPNLEELSIGNCNALKALPQFMSSLTSLRTLRIYSCKGLESLPGRVILQLSVSSLESLEIRECPQLDFSEEEDREFSGPSKLRKLKIRGCGKMRSLPWWIQRLTSLETLTISHCGSLEALPEWFPQLTSLKELRLSVSLELRRRCRRETGEDWPKISHIQSIWWLNGIPL